jgi:tRNA pseudouridine38-40 synthase
LRNIKLLIQYRGTNFHGWQFQPAGPTLQELFQNILSEICHEKITLIAASRTDSGVHALAQVAHFQTEHLIDLATLHRALNARLPADVAVTSVEEVPLNFHAQRDARAKTYCYLILNSDHKFPFLSPYTWKLYGFLDLDEMHQCLEMLVGEHDFNAFKAADSTAKTSVRRLEAVCIQRLSLKDFGNSMIGMLGLSSLLTPLGAEAEFHPTDAAPTLIAINLKGQGFLKHMVRNIVGTVVDVGLGKITAEDFRRVFESRDRTQAGRTAPAQGLFLVEVEY